MSQQQQKMRIYRRNFHYHLINAKTIRVTETYSVWIPKHYKWWVHGLAGYLPDLEVTNSEGNKLPVLSDHELAHFIRKQNPAIFRSDEPIVTQEIFREVAGDQTDSSSKTRSPTGNLHVQGDGDAKHYVAILLPPREKNYFEEITIRYLVEIEKTCRSNDVLSRHVERQRRIPRTTTNSDYISITTEDKYEIMNKRAEIIPDEKNFKPKEEEVREILSDTTRCLYRIKRSFVHPITIKWKIGLPIIVKLWAWGGLLLAIGMLLISWVTFDQNNFETFKFGAGVLGGMISILLGFHKVISHDSELMIWWNRTYFGLVLLGIGSILYMARIVKWV